LRQIENQLGVRLEFRVFYQESLAEIATKCRSERFLTGGGNQETPLALPIDAEVPPSLWGSINSRAYVAARMLVAGAQKSFRMS
jgi:hypothetical protein